MKRITAVNDFVVRFANVNGTGSASANDMFAKSIFRMGIPVSPKNIFPSNIQGLPTWYEVRVSDQAYLGRRDGIDLMVSVNPQSLEKDIGAVLPGGYFVYDNSKKLYDEFIREDIHYIGIPMIELARENFKGARLQQLLKNVIYVGAMAALLQMETEVIKGIIAEQFKNKEKVVASNYKALDLGYNYTKENYDCPIGLRLERRDNIGDKILVDGNTAVGLGAIYAGATVAAWYPITPSTSIVKAFETYAKKLRIDPDSGKNLYASLQAEDELAAIGMVIGATWNGARAFTTTSGPGVSLMSEFIGLSYFAEIPVVLVNVQRGGPSTGMPTRTQQADILSSVYASHGDTRHLALFPSTPKECFDFTVAAFDLADRLQTLVFVISDLDLGMNDHLSEPFDWDDNKKYDLGKVLSKEELESAENFGRYNDVDGDAIPYRTIPGTHPTKGSFFTRGTSHDEFARYTEDGDDYIRIVDRLRQKWETAKDLVPAPELYQDSKRSELGMIFFGTTTYAALEVMELMKDEGIVVDAMRILACPFNNTVKDFIDQHDQVFIIEQNRDAQFRALLIYELDINPAKMISILNYDGKPITANAILKQIKENERVAVDG